MPRKKKEEKIEEAVGEIAENTEVTEEIAESSESLVQEAVEVKAKSETEKKPRKKKAKKEDEKPVETAVKTKTSKRAERIGIVQSDKMTKTVTVRVDRVVKHPVYRKYIKRRKNFMAHDEKGASVGDKVRIIETRPLSARKRWRVVEIIQKAEK